MLVDRHGLCQLVVFEPGALAVGLALDDQFVGRALEPVDGGPSQERVGHLGQELTRRDDGRTVAMPLDDQLVEVVRLGDVERVKGEIIEQEKDDTDQVAHLCRHAHLARPGFDRHPMTGRTPSEPEGPDLLRSPPLQPLVFYCTSWFGMTRYFSPVACLA